MIQAELHRHLDVSIRTSTLLKLAQERGLEAQSTSLEAFREKLIMRKPFTSLAEVLSQFVLFQKVLDRPEVLEQVGFEVVEDCVKEGTTWMELRFSPSFVTEYNSLDWDEALAAFERGVEKAKARHPQARVGLLIIASRDFGEEAAAKTVEFFLKHEERLAGLDLAGPEVEFPCRLFEGAFKEAVKRGSNITIHAGEASGPQNMWEAIEMLGAKRIGHGIRCVEDPKLMEALAARKICLEMCPTSNWLTQCVKDLSEHPLPQVLRAGVPVSINTDDPGIFGVTMPHEIEVCRRQMKLSEVEISQCLEHARASSFLN